LKGNTDPVENTQFGPLFSIDNGPDGERLSPDAIGPDGRLSLTYRGPLPVLLEWLAKQRLDVSGEAERLIS
jgi:hypothetical protein